MPLNPTAPDLPGAGERPALILANLGTPSAPTPRAVRPFLREFFSDRRIEEADQLNRETFTTAGGGSFHYIPRGNDSTAPLPPWLSRPERYWPAGSEPGAARRPRYRIRPENRSQHERPQPLTGETDARDGMVTRTVQIL